MAMTDQEFFDKTLAHLRKQGKAAVDEVGACFYRADDGATCAIGCHIPDEAYRSNFEDKDIGLLLRTNVAIRSLFDGVDPGLMGDCQDAHDCDLASGDIRHWERRMSMIAYNRGIVYTPPEPKVGA